MSTDRAFVRWRAWYWSRVHCRIPLWGAVAPPVCQGGYGVPRQCGACCHNVHCSTHIQTHARARAGARVHQARATTHMHGHRRCMCLCHTHTRTERERPHTHAQASAPHVHAFMHFMHYAREHKREPHSMQSHTATTNHNAKTITNNQPQQAMPPLQCPRDCTESGRGKKKQIASQNPAPPRRLE